MTRKQIINQLESLIDNAEAHRDPDGHLDDVFEDDIEALRYAISCIRGLHAVLAFPKHLQQLLTRQIDQNQPSPINRKRSKHPF